MTIPLCHSMAVQQLLLKVEVSLCLQGVSRGLKSWCTLASNSLTALTVYSKCCLEHFHNTYRSWGDHWRKLDLYGGLRSNSYSSVGPWREKKKGLRSSVAAQSCVFYLKEENPPSVCKQGNNMLSKDQLSWAGHINISLFCYWDIKTRYPLDTLCFPGL